MLNGIKSHIFLQEEKLQQLVLSIQCQWKKTYITTAQRGV